MGYWLFCRFNHNQEQQTTNNKQQTTNNKQQTTNNIILNYRYPDQAKLAQFSTYPQ